jgi:hypothetical protein
MKNHRLLRAAAAALVLLVACGETPAGLQDPDQKQVLESRADQARSAHRCVDYRFVGDWPLGIVQVDGHWGLGAMWQDATIGDVTGQMASVILGVRYTGAHGQGAQHYQLIHRFDADDGESWFRSVDRAVCAPAGPDPLVCRVNTSMNIESGEGLFANASGHMHNHGRLVITGFDPPAGYLQADIRGRICADW